MQSIIGVGSVRFLFGSAWDVHFQLVIKIGTEEPKNIYIRKDKIEIENRVYSVKNNFSGK